MATYAIGDVQGCYQELEDLLEKINFDSNNDQLWFTGDLVNRGPDSLATLRLAKNLNALTVLGNHECHMLAIAAGACPPGKKDTLQEILAADDSTELLAWVRQLPLLHHDPHMGFVMIHAGLPPQWDLQQATALANEVETILQSDEANDFYKNMYGNQPELWNNQLSGWDRLRFITNAFTRMRFCDNAGRMNFSDKGPPGTQAKTYKPWFRIKSRKTRDVKIIFGHWASLYYGNLKRFETDNVYPLDTGCVWGRTLTAMRLEDRTHFTVPSRQKPGGE
jgi:bis(5'-nucleosyl)-tetraphosphatase (symmetrical)